MKPSLSLRLKQWNHLQQKSAHKVAYLSQFPASKTLCAHAHPLRLEVIARKRVCHLRGLYGLSGVDVLVAVVAAVGKVATVNA